MELLKHVTRDCFCWLNRWNVTGKAHEAVWVLSHKFDELSPFAFQHFLLLLCRDTEEADLGKRWCVSNQFGVRDVQVD